MTRKVRGIWMYFWKSSASWANCITSSRKKSHVTNKKKAFNLGAFVDPLCFYGKTKNEIKNMKNDTYNNQLLKDEN